MGNRIIKDRIFASRQIAALSFFEETFFIRLILMADDYGICLADPSYLAHQLYPRGGGKVSEEMAVQALTHLEELNLIHRYRAADEETYLKLVTWERHQRLRNSKRKYPPEPETGAEAPAPSDPAAAETGEASLKDVTQPAETPAGSGSPAGSEAAPGPFPSPKNKPEAAASGADTSAGKNASGRKNTPPVMKSPELPDPQPPVITLPLNDGSEYPVSRKTVEEYQSLYPAVDVEQELRNMRGWCMTNAQKRKTHSGIARFITGWLSRVQDRGGSRSRPDGFAGWGNECYNPFLTMDAEGSVS